VTGTRRVPERGRSATGRTQGGRLASAALLRRVWNGQVRCRGRAGLHRREAYRMSSLACQEAWGWMASTSRWIGIGGRASAIYRESREVGRGDSLVHAAQRPSRCCRVIRFGQRQRLVPVAETQWRRTSRWSLLAAQSQVALLTGGLGRRADVMQLSRGQSGSMQQSAAARDWAAIQCGVAANGQGGTER